MQVVIPKRLRTERAPEDVPTPWLKGRGTRWMVIEDWWLCIDERWFCVPAGYIFNGSSIPSWLWWMFPPTYAPAWEASCFHDLCYSHLYQQVRKSFADNAFYAIMRQQGARPWIAKAFYTAVHQFGKGGW